MRTALDEQWETSVKHDLLARSIGWLHMMGTLYLEGG